MRGVETRIQEIRHRIFREVARMAYHTEWPVDKRIEELPYKIIPGENFTVQIWHSRLCSELADIEEEQTYPMTEDGFHEMLRWLETKAPTGK